MFVWFRFKFEAHDILDLKSKGDTEIAEIKEEDKTQESPATSAKSNEQKENFKYDKDYTIVTMCSSVRAPDLFIRVKSCLRLLSILGLVRRPLML